MSEMCEGERNNTVKAKEMLTGIRIRIGAWLHSNQVSERRQKTPSQNRGDDGFLTH